MATIKFKNTSDLINYLCKEDVLGELQVSFTQERSTFLEASYNFDYPELKEHLDTIFLDWPSFYGSTTSAVYINFDNAEDYDVKVKDDLQWSEYNLTKMINNFVRDQIFQKYGVESYLLIRMEGTGFSLEEIDVEKLEIFDNDEETLELSEDLKKIILKGILEILKRTDTSVETVEKFTLQKTEGLEDVYFCEEGSPDVFDDYDLEDGQSFLLDTELLNQY